jgi:hypothetical protein
MAKYGYRDNKLNAKDVEAGSIDANGVLEVSKTTESKAVAYLKMQTCQVGSAGAPDGFVYVFVGTAGRLCISTSAPVGTTGAFANAGSPLGTAA